LNFVLYSRGQILGIDPGTARYGIPIQEEWYKTTLAHNTLTVDETNQKSATGKDLAFITRPGISAALAEAGPIYEGVTYRRAVALFGDDTVLVLDMAKADKEHTFDFAYHHAGQWANVPQGEAATLPDKIGYKHIQGATKVLSLPAIQTGDIQTQINIGSSPAGETIIGTGVGNNATDRVPMIMQRIRGRQAIVAWLIHLGKAPTNAHSSSVALSQADGRIEAIVNVNGQKHRLTVAPDATEKLMVE
jgi:hypothetical protein